jgi:hypothetical protein
MLNLHVDVILTNKPTSCGKICNFDCGISDVHNIISVQFKSEIPQKSKSKTQKHKTQRTQTNTKT